MSSQSLTKTLRETLALFEEAGAPRTTTEIAEVLDIGRRSTYERLERLVEHGRLDTKKVGANGRVWWKPPVASEAATLGWEAAAESVIDDVLNGTDIGVLVLDEDFGVTWLNEATAQYFDLDRDRILGQDKGRFIQDDIAPFVDDGGMFIDTILAANEGNTPTERFECRVSLNDRTEVRWLLVDARQFNGKADGVVVTMTDVTHLKEQSQRLERQRDDLESELKRVFERIDDGFFALDEELQFTYVNERASDLLGHPSGDLVGEYIWDMFETGAKAEEAFEEALETQQSITFEEFYEPIGIWFENHVYPSRDGLSVYSRNITERKGRERELEQYETIVSTMQDGVYVLDEEFRFIKVNDAYVRMTGYDREELLGEHCSLVVAEEVSAESARQVESMLSGEADIGVIEADIHRADGTTLRAESRFIGLASDEQRKVGVVRDVSERVERERELETRVRQQEVVTDLGQHALEERNLDMLMAEAAELVAETLGNDYCKVLDLDPDAEELFLRQGVGWDDGIVGEATVSSVEAGSQAAYTLASEHPVMVENLESEARFSGPDLLTDHDVRSGISTIIGPYDDPWGILGTHDTVAKEFSTQDVNFVQAVANILATAIERHEHEQELTRQREELAALNSLNEVVRDITEAVIDQSTREEIEEAACERLATSDSYLFAWVGEVDVSSETVALRAEAGVKGYLDDISISVDPDDEHSDGPTGRALRTGEVQTTTDIQIDDRYDPWRSKVEKYGFRSSAAIPIVHEGTVYGVLNVYAERSRAFEGQERTLITQLGEIIGHAIAAADRKRALMSDEVVELVFQVENVFESLGVDATEADPIRLEHTVPVKEDDYILFGRTTPAGTDTVEAMVETIPFYESVTFREDGNEVVFEIMVSDPPVLSLIASLGGAIPEAVIEDGKYRLTVHLSPSTDARKVIDTMIETYPRTTLLKRRQRTGRDNGNHKATTLISSLTPRQRAALETAFHSGFFEWPRETSGEEVSAMLDISPPTFHQHLRKAEQKVFESIFSSASPA